jgi:uncharacterized protein with HEPN domain
MSDSDSRRLADILAATAAIRSHLSRGGLTDGLSFDAVRIRLLEIGEAVKAISTHAILQSTVDNDLPRLERAVFRLQQLPS